MNTKIDPTKYYRSKLCEVTCPLQHIPSGNPLFSTICMYLGEEYYFSVIDCPYTDTACNSRGTIMFNKKEMDGYFMDRDSRPNKSAYKKPENEMPLKCEFCGKTSGPKCIKCCAVDSLHIIEKE